jgi:hypothetical protein
MSRVVPLPSVSKLKGPLALALSVLGLVLASIAAMAPTASASDSTWSSVMNSDRLRMEVRGWSKEPGAKVQMWSPNFKELYGGNYYSWVSGDNQLWNLPSPGETGSILNKHSRMCLTTDGKVGDQLYQDYCNGGWGQRWITSRTLYIIPDYPFYEYDYTFKNPATGFAIDHVLDQSPGTPIGDKIAGWFADGRTNQIWHVE